MKYNLFDPKNLPDLVRSWKPKIELGETPEDTHLLVHKILWYEEVAQRFAMEYKRQSNGGT
jgi:hypothetical protein